jgi:hypothetical protein
MRTAERHLALMICSRNDAWTLDAACEMVAPPRPCLKAHGTRAGLAGGLSTIHLMLTLKAFLTALML